MAGQWVKRLITGVVVATASCAVLLFAGCSVGALQGKQCDDGQERAFEVLGGLLTTVMGLAIKLEALDGPSAADREKQFRSGGASAWVRAEDVIDPDL
jgi:hypothetical protein